MGREHPAQSSRTVWVSPVPKRNRVGGGPNSVIKEHHTIHQWNEGWRELLKKGMGLSVQSVSWVWLFATPWTAACQASLSITNSRSLLKLMSIELVMPSNHLILCCPLLLPPSIFPSIGGLFKWVSFSHQVAKVLELQLQHQSFQWILRTDFL